MNHENMSYMQETADQTATVQKAWKYIYQLNSMQQDHLDRIAIRDGSAAYTYDQTFRIWQRYAAVFTALHMTGESGSRVGIIGSGAAEVIFAFYGLNITGAQVSILGMLDCLKVERLINLIKDEKLTDLILPDDFLQDSTLRTLFEQKNSLGLRNIILLHIPMQNAAVPQAIAATLESRTAMNRQMLWGFYMEYLLMRYGDDPVFYAEYADEIAVILHTSGTTSGFGKPIGLSDRAINTVGQSMRRLKGYDFLYEDLTCAVSIDLSNAYSLVDQVHLTFAFGGTIVCVPGVAINPLFAKAVSAYGVTLLYCSSFLFEMWMKFPEEIELDFSSLKGVVFGGSFISAKDKQRYYEFLRQHGCGEIPLVNGYGISELAGVVTLSGMDLEDESIGYPIPGMDVLLLDEDTHQYRTMEDAPCTGVLYIHSEMMAAEKLDDKQIIKTEEINGMTYICTNDLVSADSQGRLTYLGRSHQYYLHDSGITYQAGRVEAEVSRQKGIVSCGIVPVFIKTCHDNMPMLCVQTTQEAEARVETVRQALLQIFLKEQLLTEENIPYQVMIADELPRNANGKVSLYLINKGQVSGSKYQVDVIRKENKLTDIRLSEIQEDVSDVMGQVYKQMAKDIMPQPMASMGEALMKNLGLSDPDGLMKNLLSMMKNDKKNGNGRLNLSQLMQMFGQHGQMNYAGQQSSQTSNQTAWPFGWQQGMQSQTSRPFGWQQTGQPVWPFGLFGQMQPARPFGNPGQIHSQMQNMQQFIAQYQQFQMYMQYQRIQQMNAWNKQMIEWNKQMTEWFKYMNQK